MNVWSKISVVELSGSRELAGATDGKGWFQKARSLVDGLTAGICCIDFSDVRLATVSWLREAVLALNTYIRSLHPEIQMVVTHLSPLVREELAAALEATNQVAIVINAPDGNAVDPLLIGHLDQALLETFIVVEGLEEFDAATVRAAIPTLGLSAANNRLAGLEERGVLVSERRGRNRIYRPVLENLRHGN